MLTRVEGYYVVTQGRETGIYTNWEQCKKQVHDYSGAIYFKARDH